MHTTSPQYRRLRSLAAVLTVSLTIACGGGDAESDHDDDAPGANGSQSQGSPRLTGTIIEITMHTNEKGNYFEPARIEAKPGDVLRFKLATGVHNVHFVADSNPGVAKEKLPPVSMFAQLPGQTIDIPMTFGEGDFYFQCDPHALLGMIGRVKVDD